MIAIPQTFLLAALAAIAIAALYRLFPLHLIYKSKIGFVNMLDTVSDPLAVITGDYIVRRANRAYALFVAQSFERVIGKKCFFLLRGRAEPCTDCRMPQAIKHSRQETVERSPHPSGKGAMSLSFSPCAPGPDLPSVDCIIEHIRDITLIEELKGDLEEKNRTLADAMRDLKQVQRNIREDLRLARQVQEGVMPKTAPPFEGLAIAISYHTVDEVGGDLYDFLPFSKDEFGLFIGDASGHGFSASLIGMISKMSLFNNSKRLFAPAELLAAINRDLFTNIQTSHYLTCFLGIFNRARRTFTYCRAGHPMPIVIRSDGSMSRMEGEGPAVGIIENAAFDEVTYRYQPGDRFFLFTDGFYEIRDEEERAFDYDRFTELLREFGKVPFDRIIPLLEERFSLYEHDDDATLIVIEVEDDGSKAKFLPSAKVKA